jgi:hypothetical protein
MRAIFSYSTAEIEAKVSAFREMLMEQEGAADYQIHLDESGRPM